MRSRIVPKPAEEPLASADAAATSDDVEKRGGSRYRPWAELLKRTFAVDVLQCERCHGRLKLVAIVTDEKSIACFLRKLGEPTDAPPRHPARAPFYWKSTVLRRMANDAA